jgi:probable phosphoglycerate mutase
MSASSVSSQLPTRITAVRHGETAWNAITRLQGQLDVDLNDLGRWQAERAGAALADSALQVVYSSDLCRAHNTAQAIARHSGIAPSDIRIHQGLRERSFGRFEGLTYAQVGELHPEDALRWKQRDADWAPPGGESQTVVFARVHAALDAIAAQHPGEHIAIVTHGGVLDVFYRLATGQGISAARTWDLGNCAINRLLWTPQALTLVGWADTGHLDQGPRDEFGT